MKVEELLIIIIVLLSLIIIFKIINGSLIEGTEMDTYNLKGCENSMKGKLKNERECETFTHGGCKRCSEYAKDNGLVWQYAIKPTGGICTACESGEYEDVDDIKDGDNWRVGPPTPQPPPPPPPPKQLTPYLPPYTKVLGSAPREDECLSAINLVRTTTCVNTIRGHSYKNMESLV